MSGRPVPLPRFLFAIIILALLAPGCAPRRIEASPQGFSGSGIADFSINVSPPLTLAASGRLTPTTPSYDSFLAPTATMSFALFAEGDSGPVTRHAHTIFSELPTQLWRWEMETWAKREALLYTTERAGGKNWTIQMFPIVAAGDWFSALWLANGRQVPDLWLAKRWSSTPQEEMRLLAEYREPAPACMRDNLVQPDGSALPLPKGKDLWRGCEKEIKEFSARADKVFELEKRGGAPAAPAPKAAILPNVAPDMSALVGRAEALTRFRDDR